MKRLVLLILFLTPVLFAAKYKDGGFYGSLGLSYLSNGYKTAKTKNSQNSFIQEYRLNYNGNVYSPKFLNYSLMGMLRYEDIDTKADNHTAKTKTESQDYKVNLNFLKESKIPFSIYAQKSDQPTSIVYATGVIKSSNYYESAGASGSIDFSIFDFSYSAVKTDTKYESESNSEDRNTNTYRNSIRKRDKNYNFQLDYTNINDISQREYTDRDGTTTETTENNIKLVYRWDINDKFLFNAYSNHREKDFIGTESYSTITTNANANLRWVPKTKHSASLSLDGFNMEDTYNTTKSISMRQSYAYKVTKNFNFSQQSDYNIVTSNLSSTQSMSLGSGLSYVKVLSKDTRINLSLNANMMSYTGDSNTSVNSERYTYSGRAGIGHSIGSLNSTLNLNTNYSGSNSTLGEIDERYNIDLSLVTILFTLFRNNFKASYYKEKAKLRYTDLFVDRKNTRVNLDDYISNSSRIGINGSLTTKVGASYSSSDNGTTKIERLSPKVDLNFKYRLGPKLMFTSNLHADRDLIYDIVTYRANNNLSFNSRKTKTSLGYNYNKTVSGSNSDLATVDSYTLQIKFERKF